MAFGLLKYGLSRRRPVKRFLSSRPELRPSYDVAIIGGGGHGLAAAYYLAARHGVRNVAVFDKGYLGGGNTGRNTAIIRSNYLTPEGVAFYEESMRLYRGLSEELDYNILYSERGHFTLAHSDAAMRTSRWRAEVNKHLGVNSEVVGREELARLVPLLNMSEEVRQPILGALYHPPGALARHDAVAWGYAGRAQELGVEIHQETEVTGIKVENGRVTGLETSRGPIACGKAMQAVAGPQRPGRAARGLHAADPHRAAAGLRVAAAQALPRPDHRLGQSARLYLAVRPGRAGDGGRDRPLSALPDLVDPRLHGGADGAHPGTLPLHGRRARCCASGPA